MVEQGTLKEEELPWKPPFASRPHHIPCNLLVKDYFGHKIVNEKFLKILFIYF